MDNDSKQRFSIARTLLVAIPIAALSAGLAFAYSSSMKRSAELELNRNVIATMLGAAEEGPNGEGAAAKFEFVDADGDLVADSPAEEALLSPTELVFAYIAEELDEGEEANLQQWAELTEAISAATNLPVTAKHFEDAREQLQALRAGEVHIIGVSTGAAPKAVVNAGFVPLCSPADEQGEIGYNMVMLTKSESPIGKLSDLVGKRVAFVRPTSNSGCKAALLHLYEQAALLPERDYRWSFTFSHTDSITAVLDGAADVAPVASDILTKLAEQGVVAQDQLKILYESEAFPPAVIGCAYHLPPATIEAIQQAMVNLDWANTQLEQTLGKGGAIKFVAVNYKDDWAIIRRIDQAVANLARQ